MRTHQIQTFPYFYGPLAAGRMTFAVCKKKSLLDSPFEVGDQVEFCEYDKGVERYTGNKTTKTITYILLGGEDCTPLRDDTLILGLGPAYTGVRERASGGTVEPGFRFQPKDAT